MKTRLLIFVALFAMSAACNQPPATPASQDTAPGGTAAAPGSGSAASGATSPDGSAAKSAAPAGESAKAAEPKKPAMMEMEVPSGTALDIVMETTVSSATSKVEDTVRGHVAKAVEVGGMTTIPAGSKVMGTVLEANPSGKVKGRALIALRFNRVVVADTPYTIRTARIVREAEATKGEDAKKVGIGAGAGAVIGAIAGGKKGAAIGTAVGGGAGGGMVLATKGKEVSLGSGATVKTTIEEPVKINAPM